VSIASRSARSPLQRLESPPLRAPRGRPRGAPLSWGVRPLQGLDSARRVAPYRLRRSPLVVFTTSGSSSSDLRRAVLSRAIFPRGVRSSPESLSFVSARPVVPAGSVSREVRAPDPTTSFARLVWRGSSRPSPAAPDASPPCFRRFASRCCPSRAFPPRGAVPALAGRCFRAGSLSVLRPARRPRVLHDRFPRCAGSWAGTTVPRGR